MGRRELLRLIPAEDFAAQERALKVPRAMQQGWPAQASPKAWDACGVLQGVGCPGIPNAIRLIAQSSHRSGLVQVFHDELSWLIAEVP